MSLDVSALATPIGQLFQNIFGGNMILLGILVVFLFIVYIVMRGGDLITFAPVLVPLVIILAADGVGLLPQWLLQIPVLIVLVFAVYIGWRQIFPT